MKVCGKQDEVCRRFKIKTRVVGSATYISCYWSQGQENILRRLFKTRLEWNIDILLFAESVSIFITFSANATVELGDNDSAHITKRSVDDPGWFFVGRRVVWGDWTVRGQGIVGWGVSFLLRLPRSTWEEVKRWRVSLGANVILGVVVGDVRWFVDLNLPFKMT